MSTTYFSWAFPASAERLVAEPDSLEEAGDLLVDVPQTNILMSASRNNWLLGALAAVCSSVGLKRLEVLRKAYSAFSVEEIPSVLCEIEAVFIFARESPKAFAAALNLPCDAECISRALQESAEAAIPHLGPSGAEEGDKPEYFFGWLKSLQVLLKQALESGLCVVHVQPRWQA